VNRVIKQEWISLALLFLVSAALPSASWSQQSSENQLAPSAPAQPDKDAPPRNASKSSGAANLIDEDQLLGLPLNGRSYGQLATLEAGVSDPSASSASRGVGGGSLSVSGSRATSNHFLLDGTTIMNSDNNVPKSAAGVQLGSDTVFQVQVFSSGYSAEYGRSSGGVLNSITRSGTSQFHGSLFEYFRNSKLDARNFFDIDTTHPRQRSSPPPFKRNQFGATLTGPLKKDRTFFLFSFEALRDRLTQTNVSYFPDADARLGFPDASGRPAVPVSPEVQRYFSVIPAPNNVSLGGGIGRNIAPQFLPSNETNFAVRVDHKLTDRDSFFARYTFDDATGHDTQGVYLFTTEERSRQQFLTVVGTHIFQLHALDVFRFSYTRPHDEAVSLYSIPHSFYFLPQTSIFGQILIPGLSNFGPTNNIPRRDNLESFQFSNQLIVQHGPHSFKFGAELHRYHLDVSSDWAKGAVWSFNSLESFLQAGPVGTGLQVALPGSDNHRLFRQTFVGFYAQDEYRIKPRLLLSAGLRYEFSSHISDKTGKNVFMPDFVHDSQVQLGDYYPNNPSLKNFAPRLGVTWSPWQRRQTIVSSAFGLYYDPLLAYVLGSRRSSYPFYRLAINPNLDTTFFPNAMAGAAGVPFLVQIMDYNGIKSGMVLRYNFTIQQPLGGGWRLQAAYVGSRGNHLLRRFEANQIPVPVTAADGSLFFPKGAGAVNPLFGSLTVINSDAQSFYNALQVAASKSLGRGLSLQATYTYSKSVDDSSVGQGDNTGQYPMSRTLDRGLSDFDIRHRLVFNYFYNLPFGGGQRWASSGIPAKLLENWRLGGIVNLRSGTPFSPWVNVRYKDYLFAAKRPHLVAGFSKNPVHGTTAGCGSVPAGQKLGTPDLYFDPCAFSVPAPGVIGNAGRNTLIAPAVFDMDLSLQRDFLIDSKRRLQFRADIFNLQNRANFIAPSSTVFSGEAGQQTSTAGVISGTSTTSRQIQFALRLSF
jgi:hypothetical protein